MEAFEMLESICGKEICGVKIDNSEDERVELQFTDGTGIVFSTAIRHALQVTIADYKEQARQIEREIEDMKIEVRSAEHRLETANKLSKTGG